MAELKNDQKNSSLYVEIKEGNISSPLRLIDEQKSSRTIQLAEFSHFQQRKYISIVGKYANRKPIELNVQNMDGMSKEEIIKHMKSIAPVFSILLANHSVDENG